MKKYLGLLSLLVSFVLQSQIKINYTIKSHVETYQLTLKIDVVNLTDDNYLLPFDVNGFKGYYDSEYCGVYNEKDYPYNFFAPTIMINRDYDQNYLYPESSRGHSDRESKENIKTLQVVADKEFHKINKWKKKHHFNSYEHAFKNYYITNNLLILKPHEKYSYEISVDLSNLFRTNTSFLYDAYFLEFSRYNLGLHLCITDDAYQWLTKEQKKKFEKYKFFLGTIKSNSISFEAYK
ncbi:hypothetical protein [Chryseobacterium indologenes]|uniref:hypothetical protein n=1 Tax=Chryseobacterium indologenes TaxID=253 RepID=UPI001BCEA80B|nr:hypothetical protein [Chryseobacterium indologenes]